MRDLDIFHDGSEIWNASTTFWQLNTVPSLKLTTSPENRPLEKEIPIEKITIFGCYISFREINFSPKTGIASFWHIIFQFVNQFPVRGKSRIPEGPILHFQIPQQFLFRHMSQISPPKKIEDPLDIKKNKTIKISNWHIFVSGFPPKKAEFFLHRSLGWNSTPAFITQRRAEVHLAESTPQIPS